MLQLKCGWFKCALLHCTRTFNTIFLSLTASAPHQAVLLLRPLVSVTGRLRCRATALKPPQRVTAFASSPLPTPTSNLPLGEMLHYQQGLLKVSYAAKVPER